MTVETITKRIDAVTAIPAARLKSVLPAPRSVKIELSPRCNYLCGFCALRTRKKTPKKDMNFELFCKITAQMRDAGVEEIGLFYLGESFSAPFLLVRACHFLKEHLGMPYVFLTTNGSLAKPGAVEALMMTGLNSLKWSVNAADEEQFEKIMGVKGKLFRRSLDNLKSAREIRDKGGYKTRLYASSIHYDDAQHEKMQEMLERDVLPYVDEHYWLPLYSMGAFATQREEELGFRPTAGNQGRLGALRPPLPCWSAFTEGHVTADGGLSACCFDANSGWIMGDLNTTPFMEAWNSKEFVALREAHLREDVRGTICEQCIAYS